MAEQSKKKQVTLSFDADELSAKYIRLFNTIASAYADRRSRGAFMEKAIELLAKSEFGDDRIYDNAMESIESYLESQSVTDSEHSL